MRARPLICAVVAGLCLTSPVPAPAEIVIKDSPGGIIDQHKAFHANIARSRARVVISGYCMSACTTIIGMVPRERVCVRPGTKFGFHSGAWLRDGSYSAQATREMWETYPPDVRAEVNRRGWDGHSPHPSMIMIDAGKFYRFCKKARG